jgi:hypothetical protein
MSYPPEARTYFPLTQACKLIRAEYRPLWLRQSSVRIDLEDMNDFMTAFYPRHGDRKDWYCNAPRLLLLSCDHDKMQYKNKGQSLDLKPLLELRALSPSTVVQFVSRREVEFDLPCRRCRRCGYCICDKCPKSYQVPKTRKYSSDDSMAWFEDIYCGDEIPHEDAVDEVMGELSRDYAYLDPLNDFLANDNEQWLQSLRGDSMLRVSIEYTLDRFKDSPMLYLRFAKYDMPSLLQTQRMYSSACSYLRSMGILNQETSEKLDFVVAVATGRYTPHPSKGTASMPLYDQTYICGRTYKAEMTGSSP